MSWPDRDGTFTALPLDWSMKYTAEGKPFFDMTFDLVDWTDPDGKKWDWTDRHDMASAQFYLELKAGGINEFAINQLKDALGWDGLDVEELVNLDWSGKAVELVLAWDEYKGEQRLKVQWLNPVGGGKGGGGEKVDSSELHALQGRLGPELRALAGPVAQGGPPPASRPPIPPTAYQGAPAAARVEHKAVDDDSIPF